MRASLSIQHVPTSIIMRSVFWGKSVTRFCLLNQFTNQQAAKVGLLSFNDNYNKPFQSLSVFLRDQSPPEGSADPLQKLLVSKCHKNGRERAAKQC